ncbi:RHH-type proline utilization regulon transcriptional repressor/proline dehydrogenase/delta 1-pyrroline-5-carboxylate dehydrogenase [Sphingobium jiangsuense]|uniref:Bifunctional protein PutA n=2 Tax=Sphingobium jiangsuense TaxID=870476 RepID=A0A7W6BQY2_9SPHN|nr:bifunctional proline dehydrogenase/L-glutamate gamma-semialdehyde dehydrogenase PutA [Sphingobium jiangsuense]MBB3928420.1 RHH-type proline utilization regulon transcriptional repressor/proline dehydrogenase/delta 1-pyrroline-5-carboxylate dehydrogenase [Sphingobium jiangsuense]
MPLMIDGIDPAAPFARFAPPVREPSALRRAITAACRAPERDCVPPLLDAATLPPEMRAAIARTARGLVLGLRARPHGSAVEALVQEYALSSQEGVALMCLAEALLRIPDEATRDRLIRDKIADGDWRSHWGGGRSLFVNAATWGLVVTGVLMESVNARGLGAALTRLIARCGEPVIRRGVDMAMRMLGEQFVAGQTIEEALKRARGPEGRGFLHSYDMLGEAAAAMADARRYYHSYEAAIHAIGRAAAGRGIHAGPGISIKLSALHPRYSRAQAERVMGELLPRVKALMLLARGYGIGVNIDAEEADRLELSLDLLESLALDSELAGWDGLGFVVQAYGKRCPFVIDWLIDLARRSGRRLMVRLVKGAYWDAEIKRAQVDGLPGFPVYTRKQHTDVAYIACARALLAARAHVFPQFATHNAQTLATIHHLAGPDFRPGDYEYQCLHGMGEPLYSQIVGPGGWNRPCRIYAPVGTHETLLAYLVRRLLENGANSSFVNRIANPDVSVEDLIADPADVVRAMDDPGAPHPAIALPADLLPGRRNSEGLDLGDESVLAALAEAARESARIDWSAATEGGAGAARPVLNPADLGDRVGTVVEATAEEARAAARAAVASPWPELEVEARAACLESAADLMQRRIGVLIGLIMREAGKSASNAIAEVREAIDFLRYYAGEARRVCTAEIRPLGPVVCISPWNFPLAIFTGQVAAALAAGNPVLAKPAEETPLIAAEAVRLLHEAGVPPHALRLVPGDGAIGAALTGAAEVRGVMFTGSTEVARLIQRSLAGRLSPEGKPIALVAETGGQNAMIVDSSALAEQVVGDVIASAFDSAGQRCSALRVLCLQEDIADRTLAMLKGAMAEVSLGRTDRLAVDIGPVITAEAKAGIEAHVEAMRAKGRRIERNPLPADAARGHFVPPTIIELDDIAELEREVFGPVLHVVRWRREDLDRLIDAINATGYGLTFGLHTRIDDMVEQVSARVKAGNIYINRNMIGAVVGVQPFGGRGLSGTGPKAGGPLYLRRLVQGTAPAPEGMAPVGGNPVLAAYAEWLESRGERNAAALARHLEATCPLGCEVPLPGPVGERNSYALHPRGRIGLYPATMAGLLQQIALGLATGNELAIAGLPAGLADTLAALPERVRTRIAAADAPVSAALAEGDEAAVLRLLRRLAERPGPVVPLWTATPEQCAAGLTYDPLWLMEEVATSINTTASGGNASLMTLV